MPKILQFISGIVSEWINVVVRAYLRGLYNDKTSKRCGGCTLEGMDLLQKIFNLLRFESFLRGSRHFWVRLRSLRWFLSTLTEKSVVYRSYYNPIINPNNHRHSKSLFIHTITHKISPITKTSSPVKPTRKSTT